MYVILHLYSKAGQKLARIEKLTRVERAMPFNGVARIELRMPKTRKEITASNFAYGNLVVIESEAVELWGGIIRGPMYWGQRYFTVGLSSWEALLEKRGTWELMAWSDARVHKIVSDIVSNVRKEWPIPLELGMLWEGGPNLTWLVQAGNAYGAIDDLRLRVGFDWWCRTEWSQTKEKPHGILELTEKAGRDRSEEVILREGKKCNITDYSFSDEAAASSVTIYGGSAPWGDRPDVTVTDPDIERELGWPQEIVTIRNDLTNASTLEIAARSELRGPIETCMVEVLDPALWSKIGNGDYVGIYAPNYGFRGLVGEGGKPRKARVLAREVDEFAGKMTLGVQLER